MSLELGGPRYGLSRAYALLNEEYKALEHLEKKLEVEEIPVRFVLEDKAWSNFLDNPNFLSLIGKYQ